VPQAFNRYRGIEAYSHAFSAGKKSAFVLLAVGIGKLFGKPATNPANKEYLYRFKN
jgi:hypothetical protein